MPAAAFARCGVALIDKKLARAQDVAPCGAKVDKALAIGANRLTLTVTLWPSRSSRAGTRRGTAASTFVTLLVLCAGTLSYTWSQRRRLTKLGGVAQAPAWSPDGKRLAFSANTTSNRFDIYTIGADGKRVRLMTSRDDSIEPAWSPDGKTIVFAEGGALVGIDVANGDESRLTDPDDNDSSPAWAPRTEGEDD